MAAAGSTVFGCKEEPELPADYRSRTPVGANHSSDPEWLRGSYFRKKGSRLTRPVVDGSAPAQLGNERVDVTKREVPIVDVAG
jgi:hypothetical protein